GGPGAPKTGRAKTPGCFPSRSASLGETSAECCSGRGAGGVRVIRKQPAPSCCRWWRPLALLALLLSLLAFGFSLVAQAVVEAAEEAALVLGGQPARGVG